jgi:hypothetical protein
MPIAFRFPPDFAASPTAFTGTKTLDGRVYRFRWLPNVRSNGGVGAFYVDLYSVLAQPVVLALKVTLTDDLWGPYRSTIENVPPGRVVVRRTDGRTDDPALYDLTNPADPVRLQTLGSQNVVVEYVTLAEIAAANGTTLAIA